MPAELMTTPFEAPLAGFGMEELDFSTVDSMDISAFTAANDMSKTVSPQDLFLDNLTAPSTGATGYLSTPSLIDGTPYLSSHDCSPALGTDMSWPPLFPDTNKASGLEFADAPLFDAAETPDLPDLTLAQSTSLASKKSSYSSAAPLRRSIASTASLDSAELLRRTIGVTGVIKSSRRAAKELPDISVDESDEVAAKRARNTMAARKSRQKKRDIEDSLRQALLEMTAQRDKWRLIAVKLGAEIPDLD